MILYLKENVNMIAVIKIKTEQKHPVHRKKRQGDVLTVIMFVLVILFSTFLCFLS